MVQSFKVKAQNMTRSNIFFVAFFSDNLAYIGPMCIRQTWECDKIFFFFQILC